MTTRRTLAIQALLVVGLLSAGLKAQNVGIGTSSPHPSARLHIEDNARGLLIPNVALTGTDDATTVSGPATSLLIYNTATAGTGATAVTPGFYYWDGSQWVRLADGGKAWLLTGNAGTNPAVNFLGTTDAQPLCIRVDNQETFRFNPPGWAGPAWSIQRGGGNPRGLHAVDLQSARLLATYVASGDYSVIGGGVNNTASGYAATVGGGVQNTASGYAATVGGGVQNTASGYAATVGGGQQNTAGSSHATVGGGQGNTASGQYATVSGGQDNTASGQYATVGGGVFNTASGNSATVGGGEGNAASGPYATVGGGRVNTASGQYATVGGGMGNTASGQYATVGGGQQNIASGNYSAIPGGYNLRVGARSFGFSGQTSTTQTDLSANSNIAAFVDVNLWLYSRDFTNASQLRFYEAQAHGSGANYVALRAPTSLSTNTTYTLPADLTTTNTVAIGILQTDASGNLSWLNPSALGGGAGWALTGNSIASAWNGTTGNFLGTTNAQPLVIATTNTASPQPIQVWAGNQETFRFNPPGSSAPAWSIQRGGGNQRGLHAVDLQSARLVVTQVASGDYSVIGGGRDNTASAYGATVGGGWQNTASDWAATVGGGQFNTASGYSATVGGGLRNTASGLFSTVGGGSLNTANGEYATVGGGGGNTASGDGATVSGGLANTASGDYSAIPGGYNLRVGARSFGFSGQTSTTQTDLSANSNIAAFVDVDLWLYSRDRTQASQLRLYEAQAHGSGANYVALRAPMSLSANTTYTLPASAPATSAAWLQSDNTGAMSWRPVFYGTVSVDPPNINANTSTTFTVTITGVQPSDLVFLTPPSGIEDGLVFQGANVTGANTVTIKMRNVTGADINGAARTWSYMVIRP